MAGPTERVWGRKYANVVAGSYMACPPDVFRAMAHGQPYPVKAFSALGNKTLMGFANMKLIHDALMAQDRVGGRAVEIEVGRRVIEQVAQRGVALVRRPRDEDRLPGLAPLPLSASFRAHEEEFRRRRGSPPHRRSIGSRRARSMAPSPAGAPSIL